LNRVYIAWGTHLVMWDPRVGITQGVARQTLAALQAYGRPKLMYVTDGAPTSMTQESECLMHGTLPKFADPANVVIGTPTGDWIKVCEMAHRFAST
jgi:hypothetical protein